MANLDFLGHGITAPFRRDETDFVASGGAAHVRSCVAQILGTRCGNGRGIQGELSWRSDFGSLLYLLRHANNTPLLAEMARAYVADALKRWEPRVRLTGVKVTQPPDQQNALVILVVYNIVDRNIAGNNVLVPGVVQQIVVA